MTKTILSVLLLATSLSAFAADSKTGKPSAAAQSADQKAAELVVTKYMTALRAADAESIINLYDEDAVFLPADAPTFVGKANIRESYIANFKVMNVPEAESVVEESSTHGNIAIVRLATKSTVLILASKDKISINARELFILKKVGSSYKISRYMFNKS